MVPKTAEPIQVFRRMTKQSQEIRKQRQASLRLILPQKTVQTGTPRNRREKMPHKPDSPGEVGSASFFIEKHPARKRVMLARSKGTTHRPVAYFLTEEYAREFMAFIDRLARLEVTEEFHGWSTKTVWRIVEGEV